MFLIRRFTPTDYEKVIEIEKEAFNEFNPLLFMMAYDSSSDGFLIAENNGCIIGFIVGIVSASDEVRILSLAVSPTYQNRGIATALLKKFIEIYRAKGILSIKLEVRASNLRAQKLYMSLGFNTVKIIPSYYTDGENGFQMVKLLI
ncbi:MAG TPA: ribosomal protein S18-alanine N-acetyltransferase [Candidatus Acidoferrales bacterium]|nr:ribosomal protein S18-alanine N-acetyltransferase [Candidatus Acidoferrales bacterium]